MTRKQGVAYLLCAAAVAVCAAAPAVFLRGVDANDPHSGIFSTRPAVELIEKMDNLFAASTEEVA